MRCINCGLHKDNWDEAWLADKLKIAEENLSRYEEEAKNKCEIISSGLEFWKNQTKIVKKFINCDHKFK